MPGRTGIAFRNFAISQTMKSSAGQQRLHLTAITLGNRVHAGGAMAGIVPQDRAANLTATQLMRRGQILHAPADIGLGIVERLGRAAIAHHPRRRRLDLHEPDLAGAAARLGIELALHGHDRMRKIRGDAITLGIFDDQIGIVVLERGRQALFGNGVTGLAEKSLQRHGLGLHILIFGKSNPHLRSQHNNARDDSNNNPVHM
ncbi:hypothetical protein AT6N2_C0018 [Agrobacterium tumefaciens]|nr:hypothetical protein AT6N2_C0018 [Agrobacterium tumefaciens]